MDALMSFLRIAGGVCCLFRMLNPRVSEGHRFATVQEFRGSVLTLRKGLQYQNNLLKRRGGIRCLGSNSTPLANGPPTLSDYILDRVSSFLITQGKTLMPKTMSGDDPLNWLPPKLHDQIHRSEAFVSSLIHTNISS